jgi:hypothetical protein
MVDSGAAMRHICVIGDLVASRRVHDRQALQARFAEALAEINVRRSKLLASPATITLGDEYQAVYRSADSLFLDAWGLLARLWPESMRFSIGVGSLSTPINSRQAIGMDGPAFHVAREGMVRNLKGSGYLFHIADADGEVPAWIGAGLNLVAHGVKGWKATRFRICQRHGEGRSPREIAEELAISPAAVYKNLASGALDPLHAFTREVTLWVNRRVAP